MPERSSLPALLSPHSLQERIDGVGRLLRQYRFAYVPVYVADLQRYFDGEAPSGDVTTLADVVRSYWLLVHEVVECSELKRRGYEPSVTLLHDEPSLVEEVHLVAFEWELWLAMEQGDLGWVEKRLPLVNVWLDCDEEIGQFERETCQRLLDEYGWVLEV